MATKPQRYRLSDVDPEVREKAWAAIFDALGAKTESAQRPIKRKGVTAIEQCHARKEGQKPPDRSKLLRTWSKEMAAAAEALANKLKEEPFLAGGLSYGLLEELYDYAPDPEDPKWDFQLENQKIIELISGLAVKGRAVARIPSKESELATRSLIERFEGKNAARLKMSKWKLRDWWAQDLLIDLATIFTEATGEEPTRISAEIWREDEPDPDGQTPAGPFLQLVSGVCDLAKIEKTDQGVDRMIRWYREHANRQKLAY